MACPQPAGQGASSGCPQASRGANSPDRAGHVVRGGLIGVYQAGSDRLIAVCAVPQRGRGGAPCSADSPRMTGALCVAPVIRARMPSIQTPAHGFCVSRRHQQPPPLPPNRCVQISIVFPMHGIAQTTSPQVCAHADSAREPERVRPRSIGACCAGSFDLPSLMHPVQSGQVDRGCSQSHR